MNQLPRLSRSPLLMSASQTGLLVVDVQEKLLAAIAQGEHLVWNIGRLIDGAKILNVDVKATEQYPQGLGPTTSTLRERLGEIPSKLCFSCGQCAEIFADWSQRGIHNVLVAGIETHVCVLQTVLDLLADGFDVFVAVDAVASRHQVDYQTALNRMESSGATLTTTETSLFEWCEAAGSAEFKEISRLVRQTPPS